jgi:hypothetical protein
MNIVEEYRYQLGYAISEPACGRYDVMNKVIQVALSGIL